MVNVQKQNSAIVMNPETASAILDLPLEQVQGMYAKAKDRLQLAKNLFEKPSVKAVFGSEQKLVEHLEETTKTLEKKQGFLSYAKEKGSAVLSKTREFLGNKWVKLALLVAAFAAGYYGYKMLPSWDQIMAWTQRLRGDVAAKAVETAVGAPAAAAPAVTENLVKAVAPTTTSIDYVPAEDLFKALEASPTDAAGTVVGK